MSRDRLNRLAIWYTVHCGHKVARSFVVYSSSLAHQLMATHEIWIVTRIISHTCLRVVFSVTTNPISDMAVMPRGTLYSPLWQRLIWYQHFANGRSDFNVFFSHCFNILKKIPCWYLSLLDLPVISFQIPILVLEYIQRVFIQRRH